MSASAITIEVLGTPAPKGSNRAMLRGGRAVFVPGGSTVNRDKQRSWSADVRNAAAAVIGAITAPVFVAVPIAVELVFRMARPAGHWGAKGLRASAPSSPATKPDVDKLARCTLDALTGLAFDDDSRIVRLVVSKIYAVPGNDGASITIEALR